MKGAGLFFLFLSLGATSTGQHRDGATSTGHHRDGATSTGQHRDEQHRNGANKQARPCCDLVRT